MLPVIYTIKCVPKLKLHGMITSVVYEELDLNTHKTHKYAPILHTHTHPHPHSHTFTHTHTHTHACMHSYYPTKVIKNTKRIGEIIEIIIINNATSSVQCILSKTVTFRPEMLGHYTEVAAQLNILPKPATRNV